MKKLLSVNAMVMLAMMFFMAPVLASTKYDRIVDDPEYKAIVQNFENNVKSSRVLMDYLNLLVNKNDLNQLIRSGELDKEKSKFVSDNSGVFLKYLYFVICAHQLPEIKPGPTDAQFMYITGVIKDPRAQAATNGPEYEMEKALFREVPLYKLWEIWKEDETLKTIVNEQIDYLYTYVMKKK